MGRTYDSSFIIGLAHGVPAALKKARPVESETGTRFITTPVYYEVLEELGDDFGFLVERY